jgi:hypothetical protein
MKKYIKLSSVAPLLFLVAAVGAQEAPKGQGPVKPKQGGGTEAVEPSEKSGSEQEDQGDNDAKPSEEKSDSKKKTRKKKREILKQRVSLRKHGHPLEIASILKNRNRLANFQSNPTNLSRFSILFWGQSTRLPCKSFLVRDKLLWGPLLTQMDWYLRKRASCEVS